MTEYIDTEKTDMKQFAFDVVKGIDLPVWKDIKSVDEINVLIIGGAMTNIVYKVTVVDKECQSLLLRIYGNCTDVFFNRTKELSYFSILSDNHFGISLVKSFPGGRLEKWRDGYDPILAPQMREKEYSEKIATKLAEMHNIPIGSHDIDEYFQHYYEWADSATKLCTKDDFKIVRFDLLKAEFESLISLIKSEEFEVVFAHHDLQHGNILMNNEGKIMFVDFEYAGPSSIGADIANHFCEWQTDYNLPDSHLLRRTWGPTVEQQKYFVRCYLKARFGKEPTEEEVEKLQIHVHKHQLLSHMHWFLWGLLQYQMSDIDWDYWGYTFCRWNYYRDMKKEIYGVDALPVLP